MHIPPPPLPSVWISANAGSGKTTFLTRRVMALLLRGVVAEKICCITYTKAAAAEMRERVLRMARQLLLADAPKRETELHQILGRTPTDEERARAPHLFAELLDSPTGGVQLLTIHSFCQNILRRFPLEAGVSPHFTVLEEQAAQQLLAHAKHQLLSAYASDDATLNAAFSHISNTTTATNFHDYVTHALKHTARWEALWHGRSPTELKAHLYRMHGIEPGSTREGLHRDFCNVMSDQDAHIIRAHLPELETHPNKGEKRIATVMASWLAVTDAAERLPMIEDFCALFIKQDGEKRANILSKSYPENSPLYRVMHELAERVLQFHAALSGLANAEDTFAICIIARGVCELYAQAKTALHALDFDDQIRTTQQLLANPTMLGWVMSKLDHRIDHLLIDEAQDTSRMQWHMVQSLAEELIAPNAERSLLVVGDEKQSIYSFQGAEPQLFSEQRDYFDALMEHSDAPLTHTELLASYRSAPAILRVVDAVAQLPHVAESLSASGKSSPHTLTRHQACGHVQLYPPLVATKSEAAPPITLPRDYHLRQNKAEDLAASVAQTLRQWLDDERMLTSLGRPLSAGDVLILVKSRTTLVPPLIRALERLNIPVAGIDRLTLSDHLAIRDILALIRWVLNPQDDLALAHTLRSPLVGMKLETLESLCVARSGTLWDALRETTHATPLLHRALALRMATPYHFLTTILETCDSRTSFAERFGAEIHEVLDEFKLQATMLPTETPATLAHFYDWIAGSKRQIKREQESGAHDQVRILTVHGAKGLEAPVVFLVDTVSPPSTQKERIFWTRDDRGTLIPTIAFSDDAKHAPLFLRAKDKKKQSLVAEYQRLLYVALTRARDELHVWGMASANGKIPEHSWYDSIARVLPTLDATETGEGGWHLTDAGGTPVATPKAFRTMPPILPLWARQRIPTPHTQDTVLTPSGLAVPALPSPYLRRSEGSSQARGVILHRILELLTHDTTQIDLEGLIATLAPQWSTAERASAVHEIFKVREQESWLWQHPSHREVAVHGTLSMHERKRRVYGQIDRLVEMPNEIVILDYKTSATPPESASQLPRNYRLQMKAYQAMITPLYPQKPIRCAILWTSIPALMWCDEVLESTAWPESLGETLIHTLSMGLDATHG